MVSGVSARLIAAIVSTLLEEAVLVAIVLWGLPQLGIRIPLPGLIAMMAALAAFAVIFYSIGSRALRKKPIIGLPAMVGSQGKVVSPLARVGLVRIKGELWLAESGGKRIDVGAEVTVVGQDGLRLIVRKINRGDLKGTR